MKSLLTLLENILEELGDECSVDTSRDLETITARFEHEGLSYLAISLPVLAKGLETGLAVGWVTPNSFPGFQVRGMLPVLFGGFFELVFDRSTGLLLEEPAVHAIRNLRQICLMWAKIKVDSSEVRRKAAYDQFIQCEKDLEAHFSAFPQSLLAEFRRQSRVLFGEVFHNSDREVWAFELEPKHGPGATSEHVVANAKYEFVTWSERLDDVCPYRVYATHDYRVYADVQILEPGAEIPVRVVDVPKTVKTPRIIAIEPTYMQFMQQGIARSLILGVKRDNILRHLVDPEFQEPNQLLALEGSLSGDLATLDLSEASDRVSNQLVLSLFQDFPHLNDAVQATRSRTADVPGHGLINLVKFASMGSALCFPVESYVFLTLICLAIAQAEGKGSLTRSDISRLVGKVRVYGDDIIVPSRYADAVMHTLELFGLKVNMNKSFWTGKFRESCGKEYYEGHDVTLARVRTLVASSQRNVDEVESTAELRNELYKRGLWRTVRYLDSRIGAIIPFPAVAETSVAIGKFSFLGFSSERFCRFLHRPMVRGVMRASTPRPSQIDGQAALMKFFLKPGEYPIFQKDHLHFAGRPVSSNIKHRWLYAD